MKRRLLQQSPASATAMTAWIAGLSVYLLGVAQRDPLNNLTTVRLIQDSRYPVEGSQPQCGFDSAEPRRQDVSGRRKPSPSLLTLDWERKVGLMPVYLVGKRLALMLAAAAYVTLRDPARLEPPKLLAMRPNRVA